MASESLAAFYNRKVLGRNASDVDTSNDYQRFFAIYNRLYQDKLDPEKMYELGVKEYIREYTAL